MVSSRILRRLTGQDEALVAAKHLLGIVGIGLDHVASVEYFHLLLDDHHVVFVEGAPVESLFVGHEARKALPQVLLDEVLTILPQLAEVMPEPARPLLDGRTGRSLARRHTKHRLGVCMSYDAGFIAIDG